MAGDSWWRVTPRGEGIWVPFIVVGIAMGVGFTVEEEGWDGGMVAERQRGVALDKIISVKNKCSHN